MSRMLSTKKEQDKLTNLSNINHILHKNHHDKKPKSIHQHILFQPIPDLTEKILANNNDIFNEAEWWNIVSKESLTEAQAKKIIEIRQKIKEIPKNIQSQIKLNLELYSGYLMGHHIRSAIYCCLMANHLLKKNPSLNLNIEATIEGVMLHDIGKCDQNIDKITRLKHNQKLSDDEFKLIQCHPKIGYNSLKELYKIDPDLLPFNLENLELVLKMVAMHHIHFNKGKRSYPKVWIENEIDLETQILTLADSVDAMSRSYRHKGKSYPEVIEYIYQEIDKCKNTHFNPDLVATFKEIQPMPIIYNRSKN